MHIMHIWSSYRYLLYMYAEYCVYEYTPIVLQYMYYRKLLLLGSYM